MKHKSLILFSVIILFTARVFSQSVKENLDKQMKDPKTAENSAKADVYIQKKRISDSTLAKNDGQVTKKKMKRKMRCKKRRTSS